MPISEADAKTIASATASHISLAGCDEKTIFRKLSERRPFLFSKDHDEAEVWVAGNGAEVRKKELRLLVSTGARSEADAIQLPVLKDDAFYIIRQANSWDRLRVTSQTFDKLTKALNVFPFFLKTVLNFGIKVKDDDNTWHGFHSRLQYTDAGGTETCYMLHFVENSGRTQGDPWSFRQTAVYHRCNDSSNQSSWILIKPSTHLEGQLQAELDAVPHPGLSGKCRAARFHVMFIGFALQNWPDYIAAQRTKLEELETLSFFSEVDHIQPHDYDLRFQHRQNLQLLKHKLLRAVAMLDAIIDLTARVRNFLDQRGEEAVKQAIAVELEDFDAEAKYHRRCINDLRQRASDTMSLLLDILNRRYGDASLRSAAASESSLRANAALLARMTSIAVNGEMEHELEQRTAVNVRALTVVATLYLPAALLSGILSTPLVDVSSAGTFVVSSEFWKFVVVLVPMVLVTFLFVALLQAVWTVRQREALGKMAADAADKDAAAIAP